MSTAAQQPDPRREHLRQQAIRRRQAVLDRLSGTRALLVGGAVATTCLLAGYLDASAHAKPGSGTGASSGISAGASAYGSSNGSGASTYNGGSSGGQSLFGGGTPPSSSSGAGSAISGGS